MYFKHVNPIRVIHKRTDFSNICGVHHMLFAIIEYKFMYIFILLWNELVTSVGFADVRIGILIVHHRLYI